VRIEGYHKEYNNLPLEDELLNYNNNGHGFAQGIDFMIKGDLFGIIDGWISYGFINTKRKWMDFEELSSSSFDITHNLTVIAKYNITPAFQVGVNYKYATGRPFTPVVNSNYIPDLDIFEPVYGNDNSDRHPTYQRLDIRLTYLTQLFDNYFTVIFVEGLNILDINNIFGYSYNKDYTQRIRVDSYFGRRTIVFGIRVNIYNIKIDYSTNSGVNWNSIIASIPANLGNYEWTIPNNINSVECLVKICDVTNANFCDQSDSTFTIGLLPSVTVIFPNGGEVLLAETQFDITWSSINILNAKIELSINNGASWEIVIDSLPSTGIYSWLVPNTPSIQCLIKISNLSNETVFDVSDDLFQIDILPSVNEQFSGIPENYSLIQNYPNPFNPVTKIYYGVPQKSYVELTVFDLLGNEIVKLVSDEKVSGYHSASFDATTLPSGIYFYRLQAGSFVETKKMVLLK